MWKRHPNHLLIILINPLLVLLITDLFHPVDDLAVELFLNGDMGHSRGCSGTMPMLFTRGIQTTSPGQIFSTGPSQIGLDRNQPSQSESDLVDGCAMRYGR